MRDRNRHLLAYVKTGPTARLAGAWRDPERCPGPIAAADSIEWLFPRAWRGLPDPGPRYSRWGKKV
jgi:hypothetical protein